MVLKFLLLLMIHSVNLKKYLGENIIFFIIRIRHKERVGVGALIVDTFSPLSPACSHFLKK